MLRTQCLTRGEFCGVCHSAEVCRSMSGDGITLIQSLIVPDEGIDHSLMANWAIRGAPKKCLELGAPTPMQFHNEASAAPVHPRNSTFLSKNTAILPYYCLRAHILPPPLENVQPRTSRIQMKICTHIILYLSLWDRDNYSFRMGSKSPDLQRLFEVNIYLL